VNKAQLLQRQLGIKDPGRAGDKTLREASRRFLAPPLAWKPTPAFVTRLEQQGFWSELVENVVPAFVIEVIEQGLALQNIDAFFIEYIKHRLPKDQSLCIDLPLVNRALFLMGFNPSQRQMTEAKTLYENSLLAGQGARSAGFFRFCLKYAELLFA